MRIPAIGQGFRASGPAPSSAHMGHEVIDPDPDAARIALLADGAAPVRGHGAAVLGQETYGRGRTTFTTIPAEPAEAAVKLRCGGAPRPKSANDSDLPLLLTAVEALLPRPRPAASQTTV